MNLTFSESVEQAHKKANRMIFIYYNAQNAKGTLKQTFLRIMLRA